MIIKRRYTNKVLYESEDTTIKKCVERAIHSGADLTEANLSGANLTGVNLFEANFAGVDLHQANLAEANLFQANLIGADLLGTRLTGADLTGADLIGADLTGADLFRTRLTEANLSGANLTGVNLAGVDLAEVKNYSSQYEIFFELIRREKISSIKKSDWELIGKIAIHKLCWSKIRKLPDAPMLRILRLLKERGFSEFLEAYKQE